jgi:hypothetical protein
LVFARNGGWAPQPEDARAEVSLRGTMIEYDPSLADDFAEIE